MPRQHTHHSRITHQFHGDFPQRLVRFKNDRPTGGIIRYSESGLLSIPP